MNNGDQYTVSYIRNILPKAIESNSSRHTFTWKHSDTTRTDFGFGTKGTLSARERPSMKRAPKGAVTYNTLFISKRISLTREINSPGNYVY